VAVSVSAFFRRSPSHPMMTVLIVFVLFLLALAAAVYLKFKGQWRFSAQLLRALLRQLYMVYLNRTVLDYWEETIRRQPNTLAFVQGTKTLTFAQVDTLSNRVAHFLLARGVKHQQTIALLSMNRPEFTAIWLGAAKVGVSTALLNFNLSGAQLSHCIRAAQPRILIAEASLCHAVVEILAELRAKHPDSSMDVSDMEFFSFDGVCDSALSFDQALDQMPTEAVPAKSAAKARGAKPSDDLLFIYTSGTTGLPKAASVNHLRFVAGGSVMAEALDFQHERIYTALPLYHSTATILGVGPVLLGNTMILSHCNRGKFSASNFWREVRESRATAIQYIGEVCRYLLAQPRHADDAKNCVRLAYGNGLRPDIWEEFKGRYGIKRIGELYGATEGAVLMVNTTDRVGCIGYIPPLIQPLFPFTVVKFDIESEECVRGSNGLCIRCPPGEPGEGLIEVKSIRGVRNFQGYRNKEANKKKYITDVFSKGDLWTRTGDLLKLDASGCLFFVDRIGDTFRWKGENVSTNEVAEIISKFSLSTSDPNVYGVAIPNKDGRAGMVAFSSCYTDDESKTQRYPPIDMDGFAKYVCANLPTYSRPIFVRVLSDSMEITGTFKRKKTTLVAEGFDPSCVSDPLFFLSGSSFVSLTPELFQRIISGQERL